MHTGAVDNEAGKAGITQFRLLSDALQALCSARTRPEVIHIAAEFARAVCGIDGLALVLPHGEQSHDALYSTHSGTHSSLIASVASWVFQNRRIAMVPDTEHDERTRGDASDDAFARSLVAVPFGMPVAAVLVASWVEEHWSSAEELLVLEAIARAAGLALSRPLSDGTSAPRAEHESVVEWLDNAADAEGLRGAEREQALMTAEIRHRVRNVLSLVRSTVRLRGGPTRALGLAFDEVIAHALTISALSASQGAALAEKQAAGPTAPTNLSGHAVLVVEDDYFIAEEICAALRECGADVIGPASDIDDGRRLMERQRLDCAVLDVNLHGEHVFTLASELHARGVPAIFATGYDSSFLPDAFRSSIYLQKPIDIAALLNAVRTSAHGQTVRHN
jgi:CheY-like chemotaxis protein